MSEERYHRSVADAAGRKHDINTDRQGNVWVWVSVGRFTPDQAMALAEAIVEAVQAARPEHLRPVKNLEEIPLPE